MTENYRLATNTHDGAEGYGLYWVNYCPKCDEGQFVLGQGTWRTENGIALSPAEIRAAGESPAQE